MNNSNELSETEKTILLKKYISEGLSSKCAQEKLEVFDDTIRSHYLKQLKGGKKQ